VQRSRADPESLTADLDHHTQRTAVQAYGERCADEALVSDYSSFDISCSARRDHDRSQTRVEEICKFLFFARFMEAEMLWQLLKIKMRTYPAILDLGDSQKQFVGNRLARHVRSLPGTFWLRLLRFHPR